ncbi:MAG TPA: hypothetical protein VGD46_15680 [Rhizobacter sp.]
MNHPQENELLRRARNQPASNLEKVIIGAVIGVLGTLVAIALFGNPY